MSNNVSSLTCYALLSAFEEDLRDVISAACDQDAEKTLGETLFARAQERRARDRRHSASTSLASLIDFIDFDDAYQVLSRWSSLLLPSQADWLRASKKSWERLIPIRNRVAHSRPLEIDDLPTVVDFVTNIAESDVFVWSKTKRAVSDIRSNPGHVLGLTPNLVHDPSLSRPHNLPPADFDETGLLGRDQERKDVAKMLLGPWPVISILGDGELGKTSLALQVAYDILSDDRYDYDTIVWTTAKNAELTTSEIRRIETNIQDSLGLFASAAEELAGSAAGDDPIADVLEFMEHFKILLILDNLETVIDDNVKRFLRELPHGSKVLITSRIGVGNENPKKLGPLSAKAGKYLLRSLARVRGIETLARLSEDQCERYVAQMKFHPGFIKWFVAGVQAGVRPEELIENNTLLLDYCMANVFQYLTDDAKAVLRSMTVLPGVHTLAELAYLNDFPAQRMQTSILQLTTTNFLTQVFGGAAGASYSLSDFGRTYLQKLHPVNSEERDWLTNRHEELYAEGGSLIDHHSKNPYLDEAIDIRGAGDFHAARCLRDALVYCARGAFDSALGFCQEAADLAPGYHEVHRIRGYVYQQAHSYTEAHDAFERAAEIAAESPQVRYFFGRFLTETGYNRKQGLRELQAAAKLDENSPLIRLAIASAHLASEDGFSDGIEIAGSVIRSSNASADNISDAAYMIVNSAIDTLVASRKRTDAPLLAEKIEIVCTNLQGRRLPSNQDFSDRLHYIQSQCDDLKDATNDRFVANKFGSFVEVLGSIRGSHEAVDSKRIIGKVKRVEPEKGYAFVSSGLQTYFLHATELWQRSDFDSLPVGAIIAFVAGEERPEKKPPALSANWIV